MFPDPRFLDVAHFQNTVLDATCVAKDETLHTRIVAARPSELGDSLSLELQLQETEYQFRILSSPNCHETAMDPAAVEHPKNYSNQHDYARPAM
jgi:hypothetical protein